MSEARHRSYSPAQLVRIATAHPLRPPDRKFSYSNTGYIVLGMLIEKVTRQGIAAELERRILRPAGLRHTHLAGAYESFPSPVFRGYEEVGGRLTDLTRYNMTSSWTSGAIVSTAADLHRFSAALLTGKLLPAAQLAQMRQTVPAFPGYGYGLGLAGAEHCGQQIWGHVGGAPGYLTYSFTNSGGDRQITVTINQSLTANAAVQQAMNTMVATEFCGSPPEA